MSTIRVIYLPVNGARYMPNFPPSDQDAACGRYPFDHPVFGALTIDADGGAPTQAEIDAVLAPSIDVRASNAVDAEDRLLFEINFDQENRIRALEGKAAITRAQYRDALVARWKQLNP